MYIHVKSFVTNGTFSLRKKFPWKREIDGVPSGVCASEDLRICVFGRFSRLSLLKYEAISSHFILNQ